MLLELAAITSLNWGVPTPESQDAFIRDATIRPVDYVMFHQEIDDENVDRVARLLQRPGTILDMQSLGGDFRASLRFAEVVRSSGARVRVTGECASGCALVWVMAPDRLVDGFAAVTFHSNPISAWAWMDAHRSEFTEEEMAYGQGEAEALSSALVAAGIQPWLFQCANRLQNPRHTVVPDEPTLRRVITTVDYHAVWFPRSVLEQAGVRGLDRYDAPNDRQREAIETRFGTASARRPIFWAGDGACAPEIEAAR